MLVEELRMAFSGVQNFKFPYYGKSTDMREWKLSVRSIVTSATPYVEKACQWIDSITAKSKHAFSTYGVALVTMLRTLNFHSRMSVLLP